MSDWYHRDGINVFKSPIFSEQLQISAVINLNITAGAELSGARGSDGEMFDNVIVTVEEKDCNLERVMTAGESNKTVLEKAFLSDELSVG